jgi:hypothetical protein
VNLGFCQLCYCVRVLLNKQIGLGFIMLFNIMSDSIVILCFYGVTIVNTNNCITCNKGSNEFPTATLDNSLVELSRMLYDLIKWNMLKIEVKINWRMHLTRYIGVPICNNISVNLIFGLTNYNQLQI